MEVGGLPLAGGQDRPLYEAAAHEVVKVVAGLDLKNRGGVIDVEYIVIMNRLRLYSPNMNLQTACKYHGSMVFNQVKRGATFQITLTSLLQT